MRWTGVVVVVCIFALQTFLLAKQETDDKQLNERIDLSLEHYSVNFDVLLSSDYILRIADDPYPLSARQINKVIERLSASGAYAVGRSGRAYDMFLAEGVNGVHQLSQLFLEGYYPFDVDNLMLPLYVLAKRKKYKLDHEQYFGRGEVWQTSREAFFYPYGDCEDHAIALADWLIAMGGDARVVLGDYKGEGHAWVVLLRNGKEYILEATLKTNVSLNSTYPLTSFDTGYHPKFMFNRTGFWVNSGTVFTTKYSDQKWIKRSVVEFLGEPKKEVL